VGLEGYDVSASPFDFKEEREELERVLRHPDISRSTSLVRFLTFICNKYFDGESNEIREYTIAVEALGRKESSFDSHTDPIVRVTARALRKKLREFYDNEGESHPLQIVLPLGHYVPQFVRRQDRVKEAETQAGAALIDSDQAESPLLRDSFVDVPAATDIRGEETQGHAAIWFTGPKWRVARNVAYVVLALSAVFLAGFFLGRRADAHSPSIGDSFKWGDPVWSDEFEGAAQKLPDPSKWTFDTGNQSGWGNQEVEIYCSPAGGTIKDCDPHRPNAFLDGNGHLVLRAQKNPDGAWTSARITTRGLKNFQYGRIEARMKLPVGAGLWPAFWMLGADFDKVGWPASGSVDLVENVSVTSGGYGLGPSMIRSTLHGPRYFKGNGFWHDFKLPNGARVDDGSFHSYGAIWSPGMIQFYVDDPANIFFVEDASEVPEGGEWVFDHPFYILLNLAVGGYWPGDPDATTPNPADVLVDYVRVYKIPTVPAPSIQWEPIQVKAGAAVASSISLRARNNSGHVYLSCSTEPATVSCALATSVVDFTNTLSQEDILTVSTDSFTNSGRMVAPPGRYKLTITATTISGDRSQLTMPFEVKSGE
jgi:beta-glucanase (GH16 family)